MDTPPLILVVDDEMNILSTTQRLLERMLLECAVITASNADTALALVRARPIRVVLIDYHLPQMDGLALVAAIRAHTPAVQLILHRWCALHWRCALQANMMNKGLI